MRLSSQRNVQNIYIPDQLNSLVNISLLVYTTLFADMFPYEDSKILSVRTPSKENTLASSISVLQ